MRSAAMSRAALGLARIQRAPPVIELSVAGPSRRVRLPPRRTMLPHRSFASHASAQASTSTSTLQGSPPVPDISPEETYDIIIIGAANAGLALACALAAQPSIRSTCRVLLLDGGSLDKVRNWDGKGEWENRVSSLNAENVAWLESIGSWEHIHQHRSCPVNEMIIWANPSPDSTPTINFPPLGHPMARMTENLNLQSALLKQLTLHSPPGFLTIREKSLVSDIQLAPTGSSITLRVGSPSDPSSSSWVGGSLLIGADGPNSPVRKYSGIETYGHAYDTHAVVGTLRHDRSIWGNNTAFQRFLPTGPLAFLPLDPETSTMVWSTRPPLAAALKKLSPEALTAMVNAGFSVPEKTLEQLHEALLALSPQDITPQAISAIIQAEPSPFLSDQTLPPNITSITPTSVAGFPLRLSHADSYLSHRTVLVGDAAHTIHPLAGQGLNMGLADVRVLARVLDEARRTGMDLGTELALRGYPRDRYAKNHLMLSMTDHLHQVFGARNGIINWARGMGLEVINELGPLKKALMEGAGASAMSSAGGGTGAGAGDSRSESGFTSRPAGSLGWPGAVASGVEAMGGLSGIARGVLGAAGQVASRGAQAAAQILQRRG